MKMDIECLIVEGDSNFDEQEVLLKNYDFDMMQNIVYYNDGEEKCYIHCID